MILVLAEVMVYCTIHTQLTTAGSGCWGLWCAGQCSSRAQALGCSTLLLCSSAQSPAIYIFIYMCVCAQLVSMIVNTAEPADTHVRHLLSALPAAVCLSVCRPLHTCMYTHPPTCSNGLPVYNFCVAIDDALMGITHVLRAEEHLPNTLRQVGSVCVWGGGRYLGGGAQRWDSWVWLSGQHPSRLDCFWCVLQLC